MSDDSKLHDHLHENITYHSWIQRTQDKARWRSLVGTIVENVQGNSWPVEIIRFSRRLSRHGVRWS
jgi:hypothetical protein